LQRVVGDDADLHASAFGLFASFSHALAQLLIERDKSNESLALSQ